MEGNQHVILLDVSTIRTSGQYYYMHCIGARALVTWRMLRLTAHSFVCLFRKVEWSDRVMIVCVCVSERVFLCVFVCVCVCVCMCD